MNKLILISLLFFLPLLVLPFGTSPFEIPKVIAGEVLIELLLLLILLRDSFSLKSFNPIQLGAVLTLFVLSLIHLVFYNTPSLIFGNPFRMQGVFLLWNLLIVNLLSSFIVFPKKVYYYALFSLIVLAASAVIFGGDLNNRAFGTLGEANSLAGVAIFLWPFCFFNCPKSVKFSSLALVLGIIFISGSRTGVLALLIELIFLCLILLFKLKLFKALIICLILIGISLVLPILTGGGWYENRSEIWYTSLVAGTFSPVIGQGFGNTQQAIHQASLILNNNIKYQIVDSAHNFFLDIWIQSGAVGLASITILLLTSITNFVKNKQYLFLTCLLGLLIVVSFNPVSVSLLIPLWILLGKPRSANVSLK